MPNDTVKVKFNVEGGDKTAQAFHDAQAQVDKLTESYARFRGEVSRLRELVKLEISGVGPLHQQLEQAEKSARGLGIQLSAARKELDKLDKPAAFQELTRAAGELGIKIPRDQMVSFGRQSSAAIRQITDELRKTEVQAQNTGNALKQSFGQAPLGGQFNVRGTGLQIASPQQQSIDSISSIVSSRSRAEQNLTFANESLRARFEAAARAGTKGMKDVGDATDVAASKGRTFTGVTYVGTQILRSMGVEGSRALEVIGRQFLDLDLKFKTLFESSLFRVTLIAAGALAFKEIADSIADANNKLAEFLTTSATFGERGGLTKRTSEKGKLEEVLQIIKEERALGIRNPDIEKILGEVTGIKREEEGKIVKGLKFLEETPFNIIPVFSAGATLAGGHNQKQPGGLDTEKDILTRILEIRKQTKVIEDGLGITFEKQLIQRREQRHLEEKIDDILNSEVEAGKKEHERRQALLAESKIQLVDLQRQAISDPLLQALEQYEKRILEIQKRFEDLGDAPKAALEKAAAEILKQSAFLEQFRFHAAQGTITGDILRLQAGLGGSSLQEAVKTREEARIQLEKQIFEARRDDDPTRLKQLQQQFATGGFEPTKDRVERDIRERELALLRQELGNAPSIQNQITVLDKIREVTSNIADLTPDQVDFRLKALQQRLSLGESERNRIILDIRNQVPDLVDTKVLGPGLDPSISGGATSPFDGQFDPLGGGF